MNHLRSVLNVADPFVETEANNERLDRSLAFALKPSLVAAAATTASGPPTVAARYVDELWVDVNRALFRCTVAGTPGTWIQILDAVVADATERDAIAGQPTGYRVLTADTGGRFMWDGAAWDAI